MTKIDRGWQPWVRSILLRYRFLDETIGSYVTTTVAAVQEALERLRTAAEAGQPYHLALLDVQMPEMDGSTLARAIKGDPALTGTPVSVNRSGPLNFKQRWNAPLSRTVPSVGRNETLVDAGERNFRCDLS